MIVLSIWSHDRITGAPEFHENASRRQTQVEHDDSLPITSYERH